MKKQIGHFLIEKGLVNQDQVIQIRKHSQETNMKFGEAAIDLGILTADQLKALFGENYLIDFFYLDEFNFPPVTKSFFSNAEILKYGVLALGYKSGVKDKKEIKFLNIGFLSPDDQPMIKEVLQLVKERLPKEPKGSADPDTDEHHGQIFVKAVDVYLLLPDQFVDVLTRTYKLKPADLKKLPKEKIDSRLRGYLESI